MKGRAAPAPLSVPALAVHMAIEESVDLGWAVHGIPKVGDVPAQLRLLVREFVRRGHTEAFDASVGQLRSWCGQIRAVLRLGVKDRRLRGVACAEFGATRVQRETDDGDTLIEGALVVSF